MRTIIVLLKKEFAQIFRNKQMLPIMFGLPVVQLLILVHAATFEVKVVPTYIVDADKSSFSQRLVSRFASTSYFRIAGASVSLVQAEEAVRRRKATLIVMIPPHFERDLMKGGKTKIQLTLNALDGMAASVAQSYATQILNEYGKNLQISLQSAQPASLASAAAPTSPPPVIEIRNSFWYNAELDYKHFMVPGILVLLVSLVGLFLSSMNIVKEKEIGTIEQLNVTPIKKYQFIAGKLVPFWVIALVELAFGLALGKAIFGVPIIGSLWLVFGAATIYLAVVLSIGLFVSTITETQQQAMFIAWFIMIIFILMSGLFTPIESMPVWAQKFAQFNPVAHFIELMRRVLLKGATTRDVSYQLLALGAYAVAMIIIAVSRYRKTSA